MSVAVGGCLVQRCVPGCVLITTTAVVGLAALLLIPLRAPLAFGVVWGLL
ncbi:hypothetical protein [Streptomyces sp. NPDC046805]